MKKKDLGFDANGAKKVMRIGDYLTDMSGMFALGIMTNLVGQLTYFYTDKIELAVGGVGVILAIGKIIDALTDILFGNVIQHSKGGNQKYYRWMLRMMVPAGAIIFLMFTVPANNMVGLAYALITNILLSAVIGTMILTPFSAIMVVRTKSQIERTNMGVIRAAAMYASGMMVTIGTVPLTNMLGGTQSAWIKYGAVVALIVLLLFIICYNNGRKAVFADEVDSLDTQNGEETVPFVDTVKMLFKNKYWVIVLIFNLITNIINSIAGTAGIYYSKWIFGNDNLIAFIGGIGMIGTVIGFTVSKPIIAKLGVKKTVYFGVLGAALTAGVRCIIPTNFTVYMILSLIGGFVQIPLMCLYGVLLAMSVDWNEWKYNKKLTAVSSGAIGFGNKLGGGLGSVILSAFLVIGSYDATLEVATTSMRYAIYGFSNYLPLVISLIMFFVFTKFDLEEKLPAMREEVGARRAAKN